MEETETLGNKINEIKAKAYSPSDLRSAGYWQCRVENLPS